MNERIMYLLELERRWELTSDQSRELIDYRTGHTDWFE